MKDTKHTPGPWAEDQPGTMIHIRTDEEVGRTICCMEVIDVSNDEWKANARLIAAAPDLLDTLVDLLYITNSRGEKLGLDDGGPVLDKARAAIAKATHP